MSICILVGFYTFFSYVHTQNMIESTDLSLSSSVDSTEPNQKGSKRRKV